MDMLKQTSEMMYSTLANAARSTSRLQVSVKNTQTQLKLERISSLAKDTKIKSLEDLVIKLEYNPSDVKVVEKIVRNNKGISEYSKFYIRSEFPRNCSGLS